MGYSTDFEGKFEPLTAEHAAYLNKFSDTRRMKRNASKTRLRPDPIRLAAGIKDVGPEGAYFVGETGYAGQDRADDISDYNGTPAGQPCLWCQWVPTSDNMGIEWNGAEKFYDYVDWLNYLIEHFLGPWGYVLNGEVRWFGEDRSDMGKIVVKNNVVSTKAARVSYR